MYELLQVKGCSQTGIENLLTQQWSFVPRQLRSRAT